MTFRPQVAQATLCFVFLFMAIRGDAAFYNEADEFPVVTSLVFTESSIALKVVRDTNSPTYFIANRESYSFQEVSEQAFDLLLVDEHVQGSTSRNSNLGIDLTYSDDCLKKGYQSEGGDPNMTGRRIVHLTSRTIEFEMFCGASISSAVSINDSVLIGTYISGDHGEYGWEGVLVVPKNGDPVSRLDIGRDIVNQLAVDPWSQDVWVVTESQLFRVGNDSAVLARYSPHRDFDYDEMRPVVRVTASTNRIKNNPLAVLADWLGPPSHGALSEASENGVQLHGAEPLYRYAMFGNYLSHQPQWPEELAGALEHAQPTFGWRKFACLLPGEKAKKLCTTELGEWPTVADSYLKILDDRYPGFAVTGPVFGPKDDENLRKNRYSPANFADDILFGDFDADGIRDFAAVLIERGTAFDPYVDKGPIGFVAVCSGQWSRESLIEYSCSDLTEREPGGFRAELDYVDWAPWEDILIERNPRSGDRLCPYMLQTNQFNRQTKKGKKKLSIMSSFGRCDWFFYNSDGTYRGCQYCAE